MLKIFIPILLSIIISFNIQAESTGCAEKMRQTLSENGQLDLKASIGMRGWLSPLKRLKSMSAIDSAQNLGEFSWSIPIRVVPTLEAARADDLLRPNPYNKGLYIISEKEFDESNMDLNKSFIESLDEKKVVWFDFEDEKALAPGKARFVPREDVKNILEVEEMSVLKIEKATEKIEEATVEMEKVLFHEGYFFPRRRGIVKYADLAKSKIRKQVNSLYDKGYRFYFGTHFEKTLDLLATQKRKGKSQVENRYLPNATAAKEIRFEQARGNAFTVVVVSPHGELVAGSLAMNREGFFLADTIFYKEHKVSEGVSKDLTKPINVAKAAIFALSEKLSSEGFLYLDAQVVSGFSVNVKSKYVSRKEFFDLLDESSKKEASSVEMKGEWIPPSKR